MDAESVLKWVCDNQDLVSVLLAWGFGIAPLASGLAWLSARYNILPDWAHRILQGLALNLLHAALKDPNKPA